MMQYAYKLNIPTAGALKVNLDEYFADKADQDIMKNLFPDHKPEDLPLSAWMVDNTDILNEDWVEMVQSLMPPEVELRKFTMFFVRQGEPPFNAHVDVAPYNPPMLCIFGLNFVLLEDDQTEMAWFKRNDGVEMDPTDFKSYSQASMDVLYEVGRAKIGKDNLTLVNTCEYHDIINTGGPRRWCISLRTNMPYKTWEEAVGAFEPVIL